MVGPGWTVTLVAGYWSRGEAKLLASRACMEELACFFRLKTPAQSASAVESQVRGLDKNPLIPWVTSAT